MPALFSSALHPQVVHFTIVLTIVGVVLRLISLAGRPAFASPAASTLLIFGALTGVVSTQTGTAAHGPVERVPGSRPAVQRHEEAGETARNVLIVLGLIEVAGLALRTSPKVRMIHGLAAVVGLGAMAAVYEAGEHGGELVYSYAGGIGIRSGDPKDVERLFIAGAYQQAMADRKAGKSAEAAALISELTARFPSDVELRLLAAESQVLDVKNPQAAIDALAQIVVPDNNRVLAFRKATLLADAHEAAGQKDQAIAALESVLKTFPNPRLQQRVDNLKK
jgi:uncharacterized membrane protein